MQRIDGDCQADVISAAAQVSGVGQRHRARSRIIELGQERIRAAGVGGLEYPGSRRWKIRRISGAGDVGAAPGIDCDSVSNIGAGASQVG